MAWIAQADLCSGKIFRAIGKPDHLWGDGFTPKVVCSVAKLAGEKCGFEANM